MNLLKILLLSLKSKIIFFIISKSPFLAVAPIKSYIKFIEFFLIVLVFKRFIIIFNKKVLSKLFSNLFRNSFN